MSNGCSVSTVSNGDEHAAGVVPLVVKLRSITSEECQPRILANLSLEWLVKVVASVVSQSQWFDNTKVSDMRPDPSEYAEFYAGYVDQVPETNIVQVFQTQLDETTQFWRSIPESLAACVHPPYSWKVRQVLDHLLDGERIFGYRLHRIARGDVTPLPGFDEQHYAAASEEHPASLADIIESWNSLRTANLLLIRNLADAAWGRVGTASGTSITVRALAWIMAGHVRHHNAILRKRLAT